MVNKISLFLVVDHFQIADLLEEQRDDDDSGDSDRSDNGSDDPDGKLTRLNSEVDSV